MYLSKNSRCVLRKSLWFSSNFVERNFKVSFRKSRARWPKDDPTKPPLRLNIPKDTSTGSQYQFNSQMNLRNRDGCKGNGKPTDDWMEEPNHQITKCERDDRDTYNEQKACCNRYQAGGEAPSNGLNSSDILDGQNFLVKSKSIPSFSSKKDFTDVGGVKKSFNLKKVRSYEGIKLSSDDNLCNVSEIEDKNGILTIKISLNDQSQGDRKNVQEFSHMEAKEGLTSDEQIRALAEAIIHELRHKDDNPETQVTKPTETQDEAFLVIINLSDKDSLEESASSAIDTVQTERTADKAISKISLLNDEDVPLCLSQVDSFSEELQVRDLEFNDDVEQILLKRKLARKSIKKPLERWKKENDNSIGLGSGPESCLKNIELTNVINKTISRSDIDYQWPSREMEDLFQCKQKKGRNNFKKEWQSACNSFQLQKEKERRKEAFENTLRKARISSNCSPVSKRMRFNIDPPKKKLKMTNRSRSLDDLVATKKTSTYRRIELNARPIEYALEREMRMRTKIVPENYLEKKVEGLGKECKVEGNGVPPLMLKPLSKQVRLIDELPELLKYPEYKYTVLGNSYGESKVFDQGKPKIKSIRSYHHRSNSYTKLNNGTGEARPPPMVVKNMNKCYGSGKRNDTNKKNSEYDKGGHLNIILKSDSVLLSTEYPKSKLDKFDALKKSYEISDLKGPDVYLQAEKVIDNTVASTKPKNVESKPNLVTPVVQISTTKTPHPKLSSPGAVICTEERCEPDITDTLSLEINTKSAFDEASYGASRSKKTDVDESSKNVDMIKTFIDSTKDTFEMNAKCLTEEGRNEELDKNQKSVDEPPLDSETDIVINTPKMSDNIVNLANESLAENKGCSSLDSLSMMKKVKEIVDFDLLNAEKIFVNSEPARMDTECQVGGYERPPDVSEPPQLAEEPGIKNNEQPPKEFNSHTLNSVVIYDERTSKYYVNVAELESAISARSQELGSLIMYDKRSFNIDETLLKIVDIGTGEFKGDVPVYVNVPQEVESANYILKGGDSIIVYDEEARTWKVDYTLLREREENHTKDGLIENKVDESTYNDTALNYEMPLDKSWKECEENSIPSRSIHQTVESPRPKFVKIDAEKDTVIKSDMKKEKAEREKKWEELKRKVKKDNIKEDAQEIRRKNSDLYDDVFIEIKKPGSKAKKSGSEPKDGGEPPKAAKKADGLEKTPSEHYVSDNILEMSKCSAFDKTLKLRLNRVETVKLNISPTLRPPSKVTEINLNRKSEEGKGSTRKEKTRKTDEGMTKKPDHPNFYKKFEKYKTPFSDPEYEDKPMKINSDLDSNPNLKKLDSWNKTLVLQEICKSPESVDSWLKDETDKMATLLLKVLQEAAEGNNRRRIASKGPGKGNPYEAIRKKQETNSTKTKKRESGKKRGVREVPLQLRPKIIGVNKATAENIKFGSEQKRRGQFPMIEDDSQVEVITPDSLLLKEMFKNSGAPLNVLNEDSMDNIPGPNVLNRISSFWKFLPEIGCQATIFLSIRLFQLGKFGSSFLTYDESKIMSNPFGKYFTKYGPVVKLKGPLQGDVVLINRPEDVGNVLIRAPVSPARSILDSVENCRNRVRQKNFPIGITGSCNGADWDIVRKSTIDVSNKGCLHYFNMIKNADALLVNKIQTSRNKQKQVPDDFINDVKKWCMEGLCSVLFDKSLGFLEKKNSHVNWVCESERLMRHLSEATDYVCQCESKFQIWRFINTPSINGLNQAYQSLDLIISKYVYQAEITLRKKKKAFTNHKINVNKNLNFLESMLLNDRMTPEEITANLIDILLIGANTSAVSLSFLLYNLAQNSRVQRQLFKEIKGLLPEKNSQLNYHQLHSLKYLQACLKESTRVNIPMPLFLRVTPCDMAVANYHVPHGTHMVMDIQTACMKERSFDEPERFKPERWLDQDCVHPFSSIPFCSGPRASFVKRLAEIQLWTCAAKIIRNYQIEYHFGEIKGTGNVIAYPDKPLKLTFIEREE